MLLRIVIGNVQCGLLMCWWVLRVSLLSELRSLIEVLWHRVELVQTGVARLVVERLVGLVGSLDVQIRLELKIASGIEILGAIEWLLLLYRIR